MDSPRPEPRSNSRPPRPFRGNAGSETDPNGIPTHRYARLEDDDEIDWDGANDNTKGFEMLADEIDSCAGDITRLMQSIDSGAFAIDPDAGIGAIEQATRQLKQLITLPEWPSEPVDCDLGQAIHEAVRDLLAQRERPLIIRVAVDPDLPRLAMRRREVDAGLEELLDIATTHCGVDGELTVSAEGTKRGLQVEVLAVPTPGARTNPSRWQLDTRLEQMVDLGHGRCGSSLETDGTLRLDLLLETVVPQTNDPRH